jgi:Xaa-Pro aminopeptidase
MYSARLQRLRDRMARLDVDVVCLSVGPDLTYFTGYEATPLERLTSLVVPRDAEAVLVVPRLEAARVDERPSVFTLRAWDETEEPIRIVADRARTASVVAIGDHTWARFVLALQEALPRARFVAASAVTGALRAVKDEAEIAALAAAAHAVDEIAAAMRAQTLGGRTERGVHRELVERMLESGHERANFAIVASGPNAASPHHDPGDRLLVNGDVVVCDFGGTMHGYCSDITRVYCIGSPPAEVLDTYSNLAEAQEAAVQAATVGTRCEAVDAVARGVLTDAGLGQWFIHRTGHGIGLEAHEDPYLVAGNAAPLGPGEAFSIEPGVYLPGRFGLRLEDIVVATVDGPRRLNQAARDLAIVD